MLVLNLIEQRLLIKTIISIKRNLRIRYQNR